MTMKNITATEIVLTIITIALVTFNVIGAYKYYTVGTPINWTQFSIAFSVLAVAYSAAIKNKKIMKAKKSAKTM